MPTRSVWLCSRNDALGNVAVMVAAGGRWTASKWPDSRGSDHGRTVSVVFGSDFEASSWRAGRQRPSPGGVITTGKP